MRWTDGVVVPTRAAAEAMVQRFGMDPARVLLQEPVVEPRCMEGPDLRAAWGLDPGHFVVGITARVQPHRRFELLWDVARRVVDRMPDARIVLLGRGNDEDMRTLVHEPVERLGLRGHVVLPGYQKGADYDAALRTLDAFVFLVPGSDGTCRAAREAMAQGLPVVTTTRGILPELVRAGADGVAPGTVHDDDAAAMAADLVRLGTDAALRKAMGTAALARTRRDMDPLCAARDLQAFYLRLAALPRR
jgi:glycosyltransferase involved in cell wall biosynthesis